MKSAILFPWSFGLLALATTASAALDTRPAARMHVRYVDGTPMRFSSKLARLVEMNFTLGFSHYEGKQIISGMLDQIARDYALNGKGAFAIRRFTGKQGGSAAGLPDPVFTLADLLAAEVIVTNNVSELSDLAIHDANTAGAFETAVRQEGRGVLGFHASAEGRSESHWDFYNQCLNPMIYVHHSYRIPVPVYKDEGESRHVALEGVFASGEPMAVPMGLDKDGNEVIRQDVLARKVVHESDSFARDILTDSVFGPLTTPLLRFDPRATDLAPFSVFRGGNPYAFILKAGNGKSAYIAAGHDATELTREGGFDGGTGDLERFYAQMLFFLAGYDKKPCGGSVQCAGLPIVDARDHLTGERYGTTSIRYPAGRSVFDAPPGIPYRAELVDVHGRIRSAWEGFGGDGQAMEFPSAGAGVHFLRLRIGKVPARVQRFLISPSMNGDGP